MQILGKGGIVNEAENKWALNCYKYLRKVDMFYTSNHLMVRISSNLRSCWDICSWSMSISLLNKYLTL